MIEFNVYNKREVVYLDYDKKNGIKLSRFNWHVEELDLDDILTSELDKILQREIERGNSSFSLFANLITLYDNDCDDGINDLISHCLSDATKEAIAGDVVNTVSTYNRLSDGRVLVVDA